MPRATSRKKVVPLDGPVFSANPGPQAEFVASEADEILFGGRSGGGKSGGLLIAAYQHLLRINNEKAHALILRRTRAESVRQSFYKMAQLAFTRLEQAGYPVRWRAQEHTWDLGPLGKLEFGYLESMDDALRYQGAELCFLGYDEATHFDPEPLLYLHTRLRTPPRSKAMIRYTSNPGGPSHKFFVSLFAPWLDRSPDYVAAAERGLVPLAEPGQVLHFLTDRKTGKDIYVPEGTPGSRTRTYIPAGIENCPQYNVEEYQQVLDKVKDPILRAQLQDGDWTAERNVGEVFKRQWFRLVGPPLRIRRLVRSWDMGWGTSDSAAWTVGMLIAEADEGFHVLDVIRLRGTEGTTRPLIRKVAQLDGRHVIVRLPDDSGKAGVDLRENYTRELAGFDVRLIPDKGDKFERARPVAAQAEYGHLFLVPSSHPSRDLAQELARDGVECSTALEWVNGLLEELESVDPRFPKRTYLDQMDALSAGFHFLTAEAGTEIPALASQDAAQLRKAASQLWSPPPSPLSGPRGFGGGSGRTMRLF